jgi:hypothetical protein
VEELDSERHTGSHTALLGDWLEESAWLQRVLR